MNGISQRRGQAAQVDDDSQGKTRRIPSKRWIVSVLFLVFAAASLLFAASRPKPAQSVNGGDSSLRGNAVFNELMAIGAGTSKALPQERPALDLSKQHSTWLEYHSELESRSPEQRAVPANKKPKNAKNPKTEKVAEPGDTQDHAWIVFSTSCNGYQDWQSLLLAWSAQQVGHKAPVTRLASGCTEEEQTVLEQFYSENDVAGLRLHFSPKIVMPDGSYYKYANKPNALHHWLQHANPPVPDDAVIALLDPDMVLLKPIPSTFRATDLRSGYKKNDFSYRYAGSEPFKVRTGFPLAQQYGIGPKWTTFNRAYICGKGSPCIGMKFGAQSPADAEKDKYMVNDFSVGPPYLATKPDFVRISKSWSEFTPRVHEEFNNLLTEMYGYSLAAAHHKLPHTVLRNLMVSDTAMNGQEGWEELESVMEGGSTCSSDLLETKRYGPKTPYVMHYCHPEATVDGFMWSKHRVPLDIFTCEKPLLKMPSLDALKATPQQVTASRTPQNQQMSNTDYRRHSFIVCVLYSKVNAALRAFKAQNCAKQGKVANLQEGLLILRNDQPCPVNLAAGEECFTEPAKKKLDRILKKQRIEVEKKVKKP